MDTPTGSAERARLDADPTQIDWRDWGPYLSERAWGTVREDYSAGGDAWTSFPHDHARSRAYRWSEDGMAGVSDKRQLWCFALGLWNGVDPILKERMFGLTGPQGNHGEDCKDYWWYVDATPSSSWMRWRYHYPQAEFPYADLVAENARRGRTEPEYELDDTGVFADDRFWVVEVDYAKAGADDLCIVLRATNSGPDAATLDLLPTLWFRNTWSWGQPGHAEVPSIAAAGPATVRATDSRLPGGGLTLTADSEPELLFCDNETNTDLLYGEPGPPHPKDGIGRHVVQGDASVNPALRGTKVAFRVRRTVAAGETVEVRLRLTAGVSADQPAADLGAGFDAVRSARLAEADDFYGALGTGLGADELHVLRTACAGLLWGKQFFHYDVARWLDGDPGSSPPAERLTGRNAGWRHLIAADVISMPDAWEYPWFASWDLAFHCVPLARLDPAFAKEQLLLLCREWYMNPAGALPAYEWSFSDVNPPVQAWAALRVFRLDGGSDHTFLARVFHKLLLNWSWWVNRKDAADANVFQGGFLGLDNVSPIDRSAAMPVPGHLEQSDGTAWMGLFTLNMLEIALELAQHDPGYEDMATKFFEHFALIAGALDGAGLYDKADGFYYDVLAADDGRRFPLKVRSMVGLLPIAASMTLGRAALDALPDFTERMQWFLRHKPEVADLVGIMHTTPDGSGQLLSLVSPEDLTPMLHTMFCEAEFLSPQGLRALSAEHRNNPFVLDVDGRTWSVDYEPGESTTALFGGNSNWRGPVWFPVNYIMVETLRRYARFYGDDVRVPMPSPDGPPSTFDQLADELTDRLVGLFTRGADGRRPFQGDDALLQRPEWRDQIWFHEYFHGDTGAGLGASHQTGWTALVADLLLSRVQGHR